jgi:xanthine dehydrogenase accessory factor
VQGGDLDIFVEVLPPIYSLAIAGAGHIAQPLAVVGKLLGFFVSVVDDRPDFASRSRFPDADEVIVDEFVAGLRRRELNRDSFVVLVTRGHAHDLACLKYVLTTPAGYIGMIGSKMRIRTVMDHLREDGFGEADLNRVYAPIGIDISSHTPEEIAVAIAAEIVDVYRGGSAPHLSRRHGSRG